MAVTRRKSTPEDNTAAKKTIATKSTKPARVGRVVPLTGGKKRRDTGALAKDQIQVKKGRKNKN